MGMILRIASSRIVGQGDIVGRSGYFSLNLSANSVMRGRLDARRTLKSLVADLRNITYTARHTHATMMLTLGVDLYTVSKLLGHTNIQTTQIYAKLVDESKKKAIDLIPNIS